MTLKVIYDGDTYDTEIKKVGTVSVNSNPFRLSYDIIIQSESTMGPLF